VFSIFEIGSQTHLPGLASNCVPPDLCLLKIIPLMQIKAVPFNAVFKKFYTKDNTFS
jgi:hypothetical protein